MYDNNNADPGIIAAWLMPHPPVAVPEVGRGKEAEISRTLGAMKEAASAIAGSGADLIVLVSPHAVSVRGGFAVYGDGKLRGDLGQFGAKGAAVEFDSDCMLAASIVEEAREASIPSYSSAEASTVSFGLDHGSVVPLYFIDKAVKERKAKPPKLVVTSVARAGNAELYAFGKCIERAVRRAGLRAVFVASGDLSHKLKDDGPYGFDPAGPEFDKYLLGCIERGDVKQLLDTREDYCEKAAQCGFYSTAVMYGAIAESKNAGFAPRVLSYEGTFGVGYAIAEIL